MTITKLTPSADNTVISSELSLFWEELGLFFVFELFDLEVDEVDEKRTCTFYGLAYVILIPFGCIVVLISRFPFHSFCFLFPGCNTHF